MIEIQRVYYRKQDQGKYMFDKYEYMIQKWNTIYV